MSYPTYNLTFKQYSEQAMVTNRCPGVPGLEEFPIYECLAGAGEAGEASNKAKKVWRDLGTSEEMPKIESKLAIAYELGDQLWYIDAAAKRMGFTLEEIAELNINKLQSREIRGVIHGSGDYR